MAAMSPSDADRARIEAWLAEMTLDEKLAMTAGVDLWRTGGVPRLGIPGFKMTDGPAGARGEHFVEGTTAACFPCATALAATRDEALVREVGQALGEEARSKGAQLLLAPTVNLHRVPVAGRNFEAFSDDPELTARLAVAYIEGVQSTGVGACIKHFVCNDQEHQRHTVSVEIDERTLREVYLRPFEIAVREARPAAVMSAYNKLNGTWCSENPELLLGILKGEWGFPGLVVSDWYGTSSEAAASGGLDLEMPGPARHMGAQLREAVEAGRVPESAIDDKVRRLLAFTLWSGVLEQPPPAEEQAVDRPEHRALARRAATRSLVLLRNERVAGDAAPLLPLGPERTRRLVVVGPNAGRAVVQGGGSVGVNPHYAVSPLEGIRAAAEARGVEVSYALGCTAHRVLPLLGAEQLERDLTLEYFANARLEGEPALVRRAHRAHIQWLGLGGVPEGLDPHAFSVRAVGQLVPRETGSHTLGLQSAGLSRLLVDGRVVVDNWTSQHRGDSFFGLGTSEVTGPVELVEGKPCELALEWSCQGAPLVMGFRAGLLPPVPADALEQAQAAAAAADAAVVVVGLDGDWETEGRDRPDLSLPGRQAELVERVARANPRTVVVLNVGSPVETPWLARTGALLVAWYPGQEFGHALADLLFGAARPTGRLPSPWPARLSEAPAMGDRAGYPGVDGVVHYREGAAFGQRGYEEGGVAPRFKRGSGLGYD